MVSFLVLTIGIGIVSFILLYLAFNIDKNEHIFLKLALVGFAIGLLVLISRAAVDENNNCQTLLDTTVEFNTTRGFIQDAVCTLRIEGNSLLMSENTSEEYYFYNITTGGANYGTYLWNVTCSHVDEDAMTVITNLTIVP